MGRGRAFKFGALAAADSLPASGVVPGTYNGLTVNASGIVTSAAAGGGAARWVDTEIPTATMAGTYGMNLDVPVVGLTPDDVLLGMTYDIEGADLQYLAGGGFAYLAVNLFSPPDFPLGGSFVMQQYWYPGAGAKYPVGLFGQVGAYGLTGNLKGNFLNPIIRVYGYDAGYSNVLWNNINNNGAKLRVRLLAMGV